MAKHYYVTFDGEPVLTVLKPMPVKDDDGSPGMEVGEDIERSIPVKGRRKPDKVRETHWRAIVWLNEDEQRSLDAWLKGVRQSKGQAEWRHPRQQGYIFTWDAMKPDADGRVVAFRVNERRENGWFSHFCHMTNKTLARVLVGLRM